MTSLQLVRLFRLVTIVAGASAVSVVGLIMFRSLAPLGELRAAGEGLGIYLQTIGGIYAVMLAFVVYVVWGQFDAARAHVDREAAALVDLHRMATGLPTANRDAIQLGIRGYVEAVLHDEWPAMGTHDEGAIARVGERLDNVWVAIHGCRVTNECQTAIYSEVLARFNDVIDIRTSRLTSSRQRIPTVMKILLYAGVVIMVAATYLTIVDPLWIHAVVSGALAGAIAHILFLIIDLDDPFAGRWVLAQAPFERARLAFGRETHAIDAAA